MGITTARGEWRGLTGLSARACAALAAEANEDVPADRLIDRLWTGAPSPTARNGLQVQIHRLRRLLDHAGSSGPAILTAGDSYRLVVDETSLDIVDFEHRLGLARAALHAGDLAAARSRAVEALALWRGLPFGGLGDDLRLDAAVARLEELRMSAEELLSAALLDDGRRDDPTDVDVARLRRLVDEQPFREARWAHLMRGLYRCGRQADALTAFRDARRLLVDELGLEPGPDLRRLEEQILRHDVGLQSRGRTSDHDHLPAFADRLVGRDQAIEDLAHWIEQHRVVTLVGLGGMGKSRLAVAAAERAASSFEHGATFVALAPREGLGAVAVTLAGTLAASEDSSVAPLDLVVAQLRSRHQLVVIDNAEHLVEDVRDAVDRLVRDCPRVHVLLTSRVPLGAHGEHRWPVGPLGPAAAGQLLVAAVRRSSPLFALEGDDAVAAEQICRCVGHVPLLVELAAAQVGLHTLRSVADDLQQGTGRAGVHTDVIGWSIARLPEPEQQALAALAVFRGGWDAAGRDAVLGAIGLGAVETDRLVEHSLLTVDPDAGRATMLEPVREAILARHPEIAVVAGVAHTGHFVALAQREVRRLGSFSDRGSLELFDREHDNLVGVLERGRRTQDPATLGVMPALGVYWWRRSRLGDGLRWFATMEDEFDPLVEHQPLAALYSAHIAMWSGSPDLASERLERAETHLRHLGDPALLGRWSHSRGNVAGWGRGRPAESLDWFRQAHETLVAANDPFAMVSAISEGYMAVRAGCPGRAQEILGILRNRGDGRGLSGAVGPDMVSGMEALYAGDLVLADRLLVAACEGLAALGVGVLKGPGLTPLVWTAALAGRFQQARARAEDAYRFARDEGGGWRVGDACAGFGLAEAGLGHRQAAAAWFRRGLHAAIRAPELDSVIASAAGLVEVGDWADEQRRALAAGQVRRLYVEHHIATPAGTEALFPTVSATDPSAGPVSIADLVHSLREVIHG